MTNKEKIIVCLNNNKEAIKVVTAKALEYKAFLDSLCNNEQKELAKDEDVLKALLSFIIEKHDNSESSMKRPDRLQYLINQDYESKK